MFRKLFNLTPALFAASLVLSVPGCGKGKQDAITSISLGQTAQSHGQHTDAIEEFTRALLADPDNAEALKYRAISYSTVNNEQAAMNDLRMAIKFRPDWADLWYQRALIHQKHGRNISAIKDLNHALMLEEAHTSALMARGNLLWKMGDRNKSLTDLQAAVDSSPNKVEHRRLLADRQLEMNQLKSAIGNYSYILKENPGDSSAWLARSNCHNKIGQQQFALLDLNEALKLIPDEDNELRYRRVHLLRLLERDEEVISELEAIARRDRDDMSLRREILSLAQKCGNHRAIVAASSELIRKDPNDANLYRIRGLANYRLKRMSSAIQDIGEAVKFDSGNIDLRLMRARMQKENVEYLGLIHNANQILKRWPENAEAYFLRAHAELALANESAAIRNLTDGLKYEPENEEAAKLLAKLETKREQRLEDLRQAYRKRKSQNMRALEAYHGTEDFASKQTPKTDALTTPKVAPAKTPELPKAETDEAWSLDTQPAVVEKDSAVETESAALEPSLPAPQSPKPQQEAVAATPVEPPVADSPKAGKTDDWETIQRAPVGTLVGTPREDDPNRVAPRIVVKQPPVETEVPALTAPDERTELIDVEPKAVADSANATETDPFETANSFDAVDEQPPTSTEIAQMPESTTVDSVPAITPRTAQQPTEVDETPWTRTEPNEARIANRVPSPVPPAITPSVVEPTDPIEQPAPDIAEAKPQTKRLDPVAVPEDTKKQLAEYLVRGKHYREKGQLPLAAAEFTEAIAAFPNATELYIERSRVFAKMGEVEAALVDLRLVQERNPGYTNGWLRLGELYLEAGKFGKAVDVFSKILDREPTNVIARVGRGRAFNGLNDISAARADLDVAVQTASKNIPARVHRSYVAARMKHYDTVIADTTTAIDLGSDDPDLRYRRGVALLAMGKSEPAIDDLSVFLKTHPTNKHALAQRAHAYTTTGMHDASIADWSEVLNVDPNYPEALSRRAMAFGASGDHNAAIADFTKAIQTSPAAELYYQRALAYRRLGIPNKAIDDLGTAIQVNPRYVDALEHRAMLLVAQGKATAAISDLTAAIAANPKRSATYYNRGVLLSRTGQNEKAIDDYNTAIMLNNKLSACYLRRGIAHQKLGHADQAFEDYSAAIKLEEKLHQAFYYRGRLNLRKDKSAEAIADFQQALKTRSDFAPAWFGLAQAYEKSGNTQESIEALTETIKHKADHYLAMNIRGEAFAKLEQFNKAESDFRRATNMKAGYAPAWNNLALLRATCPDAAFRNPNEAIMFARKACDLTNMQQWDYLKTLAVACAEAGDFAQAQQWSTRAESLAPASAKQSVRQLTELYRSGRTARQ